MSERVKVVDRAGTMCLVGGRHSGRGWSEDCVGVSSASERKGQTLMGVMVVCDSPPGVMICYVLLFTSKGILRQFKQKAHA